MIKTASLGYPRIGLNRELKFALEKYWQSKSTRDELEQTARQIQIHNWKIQKDVGIDYIPSNDFSLYDHVLDMVVMLGAIPDRFLENDLADKLAQYFAMARGYQNEKGQVIPALEMTKWFNTNYHFLVPEIAPHTEFKLNSNKPISAFQLAMENGIRTHPVILGPVSFLLLSKAPGENYSPLQKLEELLPIYQTLFTEFQQAGVERVQLDEPYLACDLNETGKNAYKQFFHFFQRQSNLPAVILTTYFADISQNIDTFMQFPFKVLHIDATETDQISTLVKALPDLHSVSLGVVSGRNIWRADLRKITNLIEKIQTGLDGKELVIAPSCSLLHVPQDVGFEDELDEQKKSWFSFARQKLEEITALKVYLEQNRKVNPYFDNQQLILADRNQYLSSRKSSFSMVEEQESGNLQKYKRNSDYPLRKTLQRKKLNLPLLPTTTIGSFPQTAEVRQARAKFNRGELDLAEYESFMKKEIAHAVDIQEKIGLDVLVHGEFERNDMVQFFGEKLEGFLFTRNGWVQSFGSRYVRPPIIFGPVRRPNPMTTEWTRYAQSLTNKPLKGMLTGPVTMLQWSFVRDDQPRSQTCFEIAQAIRQEVLDLEALGTAAIQIDEPALREGLPLQKANWEEYLTWAVTCFRVASSGVKDETQIHTHMCYAEFNDIMPAISDMDADVISIEASRSGMELLNAFRHFDYPNEVGPGIYDIHSPSVPSVESMVDLLQKALEVIPPEKLWVNPDCGLKTRKWEEAIPSLKGMVSAAVQIKETLL